jgi:hypothetical protein
MSVNHSSAAVTCFVTRKKRQSRVKTEMYDVDHSIFENCQRNLRHPDLEYDDMQPDEDGLTFSEYHNLEW